MSTALPRYTGSCLCGSKASSGPLTTNAPVAQAAFHLTAGRELLADYESSPGEIRAFCRSCGSPIYSQRVGRPGVLRIRVGTINQPLNVRPVASYYTGSKCNWWEIHDGLPRFEAE